MAEYDPVLLKFFTSKENNLNLKITFVITVNMTPIERCTTSVVIFSPFSYYSISLDARENKIKAIKTLFYSKQVFSWHQIVFLEKDSARMSHKY